MQEPVKDIQPWLVTAVCVHLTIWTIMTFIILYREDLGTWLAGYIAIYTHTHTPPHLW